MRTFQHLTKTQRLQLETLLSAKHTKKEIAQVLGVHLSTIYRELRRGEYQHKINIYDKIYGGKIGEKFVTRYSSDKAHERYRINLKNKGADIKLGKDYAYAEYLERKVIDEKLSPSAVLGEIKRKGLKFNTTISVNTFYKYIEKGYFSRLELKHLPMKEKRQKQRKRGVVVKRAPRGISIEKRPIEILERKTFGHWEMDCLCGTTLHTFLVLTERLTRKELIFPMARQTAGNVVACLDALERSYGNMFSLVFKSITMDNGAEFSDVAGIERSVFTGKRTTTYYSHPYCSSERGTNERLNREIRRLVPKGTDLGKYTVADVKEIERWVNAYPRQVLGFATSEELFSQQLRCLA